MKRVLLSTVFVGFSVLTVAAVSSAQDGWTKQQENDDLPSKIWKRGLAISPVQLDFTGKDKRLVGAGSYLVNAAGACADCHTDQLYTSDGDPFRGLPEQINVAHYLAGGRAFGPFVSRNLTPLPPSNRPAGLTLDEFIQTMRTGRDFKNAHPQFGPLLQVMPWPITKNLTDDDLRAIYEYLRAVPHAEPGA